MTVADIHRAKREGKTAVMLNFQNATHIGDDLDNVNMFFNLGVRSMQLTYNERNLLGDGSTERTDAGLSDFGVLVVERMNELGMLVDSGHCGQQTTNDAIRISKKTPIISHANCYALNPHPRNKTDEQIRMLAARGGVMGLTTANILIKKNPPANLDDFLAHLDHVVKLVGIDHVAAGSDQSMRGWRTDAAGQEEFTAAYGEGLYKPSYRFRYPLATEGVNDIHRWHTVAAALIKHGYKEEDILKFLGGNWLRVYKENFG
jgi:membrane dipeptidase